MASNYVDRTIKIPASQPTVTLDPDKYMGTIGLAADKPNGSPAPHYTDFPENARTGNWLQVVSEITLAKQLLLKGEEWYCFKAKTDTQSPVWTRSQAGQKADQFPTSSREVGFLQRTLGETTAGIPNNALLRISFPAGLAPECKGVFDRAEIKNSPLSYTNLSDLVLQGLEFEIYAFVSFSPDRTGERTVSLSKYVFYPFDDDPYAVLIEATRLKQVTHGAVNGVDLVVSKRTLEIVEPLDEMPLTYALTLLLSHTAGATLNLSNTWFTVKAWT